MPDPSEEFYKHKNLSLLRKIQADGLFNNFLGYTHNFCLSQILPKSRLVLSLATSHYFFSCPQLSTLASRLASPLSP
jgi:hypothetical protein